MLQLSKRTLDVGLATPAIQAARSFYKELMGFDELPGLSMGELGQMARFRVGQHVLKLYDFTRAPEVTPGGTDKANGMRLLAFIVEDLERVLARFDAVGHKYNRLAVPDSSPFRVVFTSDADGNALELVGLNNAPAGFETRLQIGLTVANVQRSRRFYGELLGLEEEPEMKLPASLGTVGNVRYGFVLGSTTIKFWSKGELPTKTGAPARYTGIRLITVQVEDIDATHEQLKGRGVEIKVPPQDFQGLARVMFISDPDGNFIEFASAR
ncbi:MAG TPA: VOC family protein [Polyangiales bacterium]|nr:VOC family protein [Polyangiales bacterium]